MPDMLDVVILGAGPHGLAMATHLRTSAPTMRVAVVDPAGSWLAGWRNSFGRHRVTMLRSPVVHHPGPDPGELDRFTSLGGHAITGLPYGIPHADTFASFCDALVERHGLASMLVAARAEAIVPTDAGLCVELDSADRQLVARRVVVATNPHRRLLPGWLPAVLPLPTARLAHADDVDLREVDVRREHVVVVGGGMTAAHLALGAAAGGARVTVVSRRPLAVRNFDVDPGWLGPKELDRFHAEADPARRLALARAARGGGSIPPWLLEQLAAEPAIELRHDLVAVGRQAEAVILRFAEGEECLADRVWLATGSIPSVDGCRPLRGLLADIPAVDGLPVPAADLRIGPWPIHVMGRLAAIALGPAAGNLWGARLGARAIMTSVVGATLSP